MVEVGKALDNAKEEAASLGEWDFVVWGTVNQTFECAAGGISHGKVVFIFGIIPPIIYE